MNIRNTKHLIQILLISASFFNYLYGFDVKFKKENINGKLSIGVIGDNIGYGAIELDIEKNYKTYWRTPGENGFPLEIDISQSNLEKLNILWPYPTRYKDKYGLQNFIYTNKVIIPFEFKVKSQQSVANFILKMDFAICDEVCIPYEENFSFTLPVDYLDSRNYKEILNILNNKVPKKITPSDINFTIDYFNNNIVITFDNYIMENIQDIFVENENFIFLKPQISNVNNKISAKIDFIQNNPEVSLKNQDLIITLAGSNQSYEINYIPNKLAFLLWVFLFAFIGGVILNIMPCVLPVISLKIAQLTYSDCKISYKNQLLLTILGLFASFMVIALIIGGLQKTGEIVGWGFHFQNPIFIIFMLFILLIFSLIQFGLGTLNLSSNTSSWLNNILNKLSYDSWIFHFFYGIIITLLATPCTAPFLGTSVAFALTQGFLTIIGIFLSIALGLSLPYILLLILPKNIKVIPKAGNWLNYVKYFAGFLLYASCLWLYYVLIQQTSIIIASFIFVIMHLIVLGFFKTKFKVLFLILGFTLFSLSFFINNIIENQSLNISEQNNDLNWHRLEPELFNDITINQNKIIFIDITARWCLTCKFNEINVLSDEDVKNVLSQNNIYLIKEDITKPNKKVMDFIYTNNRRGIPFYAIIINGKINVLSEILNKNELIKLLTNGVHK